jgi:uncharacterized membrane protein YcaP (DUF421 family)
MTEFALEIAGRTLIVFVWCAVAVRLWGKRGLGELNVYDMAALMAMANGVQNGMTKGSGRIVTGLVSSFVLIVVSFLMSRFLYRIPRAEKALVGIPRVLVRNGRRYPEAMKSEGVTDDELHRGLREHGLERVEEARLVVLENDGSLSVLRY